MNFGLFRVVVLVITCVYSGAVCVKLLVVASRLVCCLTGFSFTPMLFCLFVTLLVKTGCIFC